MSFKITGSGSCIPSVVRDNSTFLDNSFYDEYGSEFGVDNKTIIEKFNSITGINERKYANSDLTTSDLAYLAAKSAIKDADIDPEALAYIIVAHKIKIKN